MLLKVYQKIYLYESYVIIFDLNLTIKGHRDSFYLWKQSFVEGVLTEKHAQKIFFYEGNSCWFYWDGGFIVCSIIGELEDFGKIE